MHGLPRNKLRLSLEQMDEVECHKEEAVVER